MTYAELKTAIQNYVQTSEATFTSQINDFIRTAEDRVYRSVQMPAFWKTDSSGTLSAGTTVTLPTGSLEVYDFRICETDTSTNGPWRYLLRKDWDFLFEAYPGDETNPSEGLPKYYAVSSATKLPALTLAFAPAIAASEITNYQIDYYGKVAADSIITTVAGTWLSVTFPDILLHGALTEAYGFMKGEPGLIQYYEQMFSEGIATMASTVTGEQVNVGTPAGA